MTCDQLRIDAQLISGLKIESATSFIWAKDGINFIVREYDKAAPFKSVTVEITEDGGTYQIPEELAFLEGVINASDKHQLSQQFYTPDPTGLIIFAHKGTYTINYRYVPDAPQTTTTELEIPDRYAEPLKYYLAAKIRARVFGQSDSDAQTYETLFNNYLESADATMARAVKRHRRMPPRI